MRIPAEITVKRWLAAVTDARDFYIKHDGLDIFVDRGGWASKKMEDGSYNGGTLGRAKKVIEGIAKGQVEDYLSPIKEHLEEDDTIIVEHPREVPFDSITSSEFPDDLEEPSISPQIQPSTKEVISDDEESEVQSTGKGGRRGKGKSEELAKRVIALKKEGKDNKEIVEVMGFKNVSSVYDYVRMAVQLGL